MVFSSAVFLFAFLPVTFLLSRLCRSLRAQNALLALMSLVFYAFGQLRYVPLFLCSVLLNFLAGAWLRSPRPHRKGALVLAVVLNLGLLGVFKYTDFILSTLNLFLPAPLPLTGIVLPIGISFFTFQGMSYVIDVYRRPEEGTGDFFKLLLYIAFFPQLIAGPIVKYHQIAPQIDARAASAADVEAGGKRFVRGLGKKLLLADTAALIADRVYGPVLHGLSPDGRLLWLGVVCYSLQIYFDFSGYSDMAVGMGCMFGFTIPENFRFPYGADSLREFWRRWHISLSSWFREYLYIPLGGNRRGRLRTAANKLIVFLCTGIWHGANWTFLLWGLGHGLLTGLEDLLGLERLRRTAWGRLLGRAYTLLAVVLLFALFRADSLADAALLFRGLFTAGATAEGRFLLASLSAPQTVFLLVLSVFLAGNTVPQLRARYGETLAASPLWRQLSRVGSLLLLLLCIMSLARGGFHPFIYFQF
ncbi:MAG: MBOAT family protein [Oscillospiraceae bacterium]|nr:MBOAT family protein [Oscillospiraceae bacterium]